MTPGHIRVRVLLFAAYREAVGTRELTLDVDDGATAEAIFLQLAERYANLGPLHSYTAFAVNRAVVDPDTRLESGDELAFLQPLGGGCN